MSASFTCRTIRIGTHKFDSKEKVVMTTKGIRIVAPSVKNPKDISILNIQHSEIIKVVTHFSKQLHIIFLYTKPSCARYIAEQLSMTLVNDKCKFFFDSISYLILTNFSFSSILFATFSK
jgi:hypothetical protein